ncbi:MAG TPA: PQQ-binding-like beta-propeller repeat protein [Puia sp.]|nr:PQQ-binding-like beta-propeller repeat protein [Puia sp.]
MKKILLPSGLLLLLLSGCTNSRREKGPASMVAGKDWPVYGGNRQGNRYSPLRQIDLNNVKDLQVAWTYNSADSPRTDNPGRREQHEIQCQPIVVNGILYGTNARLKLFALDAATGKEIWKFDPFKEGRPRFNANRGVVYWENGDDRRILYTAGSNLYAVNAETGLAIESFGIKGKVDLHEGLSINFDASKLSVTATTPGAIFHNTLILGSTVSELGDAAPGYVRGFDVVTGKLNWTFHTVPLPGEPGYDTWPKDAYKMIGATNNWSGLTVDEKRGAVYFGTGSPASDFYGGGREGANLFSDCIISLQAETGKLNWYYQTIHHDLWDRDMPCPPNLVTVRHNGKMVDAVAQAGKDGCIYVLDRDSGTSLFPVEDRPVPMNALPGEHPWPTQRYPVKPAPFTNQIFTEADITDISPEAHAYIKKLFDQTTHDNKFTPPTEQGTLLYGYSGGAEWGGNAVDSDGILYQNGNNALWELQMVSMEARKKEIAALSKGNGLYIANCAACHGPDRKGNGKEIPELLTIGSRLKKDEIAGIVKSGQGRMPSFQGISQDDRNAIVDFLLNVKVKPWEIAAEHRDTGSAARGGGNKGAARAATGLFPYKPEYISKLWEKVTDQDGYPAVKPPWGTLNAIDLNTGDYIWRVPLGEFPELTKKGIPPTGTESYGGPLATAGGLIFIAATRDEMIRAFDKKTGKIVWQYQLPAGGFATPVTYEVDGKQYVVIAAGGARGLKPGGTYIAFALPGNKEGKQ